jgi:hypothetical protein
LPNASSSGKVAEPAQQFFNFKVLVGYVFVSFGIASLDRTYQHERDICWLPHDGKQLFGGPQGTFLFDLL